MRSFSVIIAVITLGASPFAATGYSQAPRVSKDAGEKEATCRISGTVIKLADGAPLKGATVRLENGEDREHKKLAGDFRKQYLHSPEQWVSSFPN